MPLFTLPTRSRNCASYRNLASASRASCAASMFRSIVITSPPATITFLDSAFSSASTPTPISAAALSSAADRLTATASSDSSSNSTLPRYRIHASVFQKPSCCASVMPMSDMATRTRPNSSASSTPLISEQPLLFRYAKSSTSIPCNVHASLIASSPPRISW